MVDGGKNRSPRDRGSSVGGSAGKVPLGVSRLAGARGNKGEDTVVKTESTGGATGVTVSNAQAARVLELELVREKTLEMQLELQKMVHRTVALERKIQQDKKKAENDDGHGSGGGGEGDGHDEDSGRSELGQATHCKEQAKELNKSVHEAVAVSGSDKGKVEGSSCRIADVGGGCAESGEGVKLEEAESVKEEDGKGGDDANVAMSEGQENTFVGNMRSNGKRRRSELEGNEDMTGRSELEYLKKQHLEFRRLLDANNALISKHLQAGDAETSRDRGAAAKGKG